MFINDADLDDLLRFYWNSDIFFKYSYKTGLWVLSNGKKA